MHRWLLVFSIAVLIALAGWLLALGFGARRARQELTAAKAEMQVQKFGLARARLERLSRQSRGRGEVEYLLGYCERMEKHPDAALAAWGRVPADATEAPMAALAAGGLALEVGRYALAESYLERASRVGKDIAVGARELLGQLHWLTGRRDEYVEYLHSRAVREKDPSGTLRVLWNVDTAPIPIDSLRADLANAQKAAPDDDRVWLALANLAIRLGKLDEANNWLERAERARPNDEAVRRERVRWATAADRPEEVVRAAEGLTASSLPWARVLGLRTWLAARNGDPALERGSLEELLTLEPGDTAALDRLVELAARQADFQAVAELRSRKASIDAAHEQYRALSNEQDLAPRAKELARAAERLGRSFDALSWWRLAASLDPKAEQEAAAAFKRLKPPEIVARPAGETLAEALSAHRPIQIRTAPAQRALEIPTFTEEGTGAGLIFPGDSFKTETPQHLQTMSRGVALLDFDGDGWVDVYATGGPIPDEQAHPRLRDRLFRNTADGKFQDVTEASGLVAAPGGTGHGVAVGDYDNDGRSDVFVTRSHSYALYRNLGQGRFQDVTAQTGLAGPRDYPTGAAWADLDNDGDLDLYVCHYVKWNAALSQNREDRPGSTNASTDARQLPAASDHVFRNDAGRFVDVTREAGIIDRDGRGLSVVAADLDNDGKTDLFVANESTPNFFFRNDGEFHFTEGGELSGLWAGTRGGYASGTGIASGDFDGDGRTDLAVTGAYGECTTLFHNLSTGLFSDWTEASGLYAPTRHVRGFGIAALDANNDGRLDLAQANGAAGDEHPGVPSAMTAQLFLGDGTGKLRDVSTGAGGPWIVPRVARGLAAGDFNNDGRVDLLLVARDGPLSLFRNGGGKQNRSTSGHYVTIKLEGTVCNRDGVGANVVVTALGKPQTRERLGGGSYLSANDARLHFGLGAAEKIDRIAVKWPKGRVDVYKNLRADTGYLLREGDPTARALQGFKGPPAIEISGGNGRRGAVDGG